MNIEGIILMWICYIPIFFFSIEFAINKAQEKRDLSYIFIAIPLIFLAVGLSNIKRTNIKQPKAQYEQVTETFYRKIK